MFVSIFYDFKKCPVRFSFSKHKSSELAVGAVEITAFFCIFIELIFLVNYKIFNFKFTVLLPNILAVSQVPEDRLCLKRNTYASHDLNSVILMRYGVVTIS